MKGTDFAQQMMNVSEPARSALALKQILAGNMPVFMARRERCFTDAVIDGAHYRCEYSTPPNYLGVGEEPVDFVTWPLSIIDLQAYCTAKGDRFYIPPAKIIYNNWLFSRCKILPQAIWPGHPVGGATEAILDEQGMIDAAMKAQGCPLDAFIRAKKAYNTAPNVARTEYGGLGVLHFTGWYYPGGSGYVLGAAPHYGLTEHRGLPGGTFGQSIQGHDETGKIGGAPGHEATYADYSHGCDVVYAECTVNGVQYDFADVCAHPKMWVLVSDQGPFVPKYPNRGLVGNPVQMPPGNAPPAGFKGDVFRSDASGTPKLVRAATPAALAAAAGAGGGVVDAEGGFPWVPVLIGTVAVSILAATIWMPKMPAPFDRRLGHGRW